MIILLRAVSSIGLVVVERGRVCGHWQCSCGIPASKCLKAAAQINPAVEAISSTEGDCGGAAGIFFCGGCWMPVLDASPAVADPSLARCPVQTSMVKLFNTPTHAGDSFDCESIYATIECTWAPAAKPKAVSPCRALLQGVQVSDSAPCLFRPPLVYRRFAPRLDTRAQWSQRVLTANAANSHQLSITLRT